MSALEHNSLQTLFAPLTRLTGIGPALSPLLARAIGGDRIIDLLFHLPESYLDRRDRPTIATAVAGTIATLAVEVVRHEPPANSRQPCKLYAVDDYVVWNDAAPVPANLANNTPAELQQPSAAAGLSASLRGR